MEPPILSSLGHLLHRNQIATQVFRIISPAMSLPTATLSLLQWVYTKFIRELQLKHIPPAASNQSEVGILLLSGIYRGGISTDPQDRAASFASRLVYPVVNHADCRIFQRARPHGTLWLTTLMYLSHKRDRWQATKISSSASPTATRFLLTAESQPPQLRSRSVSVNWQVLYVVTIFRAILGLYSVLHGNTWAGHDHYLDMQPTNISLRRKPKKICLPLLKMCSRLSRVAAERRGTCFNIRCCKSVRVAITTFSFLIAGEFFIGVRRALFMHG